LPSPLSLRLAGMCSTCCLIIAQCRNVLAVPGYRDGDHSPLCDADSSSACAGGRQSSRDAAAVITLHPRCRSQAPPRFHRSCCAPAMMPCRPPPDQAISSVELVQHRARVADQSASCTMRVTCLPVGNPAAAMTWPRWPLTTVEDQRHRPWGSSLAVRFMVACSCLEVTGNGARAAAPGPGRTSTWRSCAVCAIWGRADQTPSFRIHATVRCLSGSFSDRAAEQQALPPI